MPSKGLIFLLMFVGSMVGGFVPELFGGSAFSFTALFTSAAGAVAGLWLAFRLSKL